MRHRWSLDVDGRRCTLDVQWDTILSGRGEAWLDGVEVGRWWSGWKFPGVTTRVQVHGRTVTLVQLLLDFDIDLSGAPSIHGVQPPLPPGYCPTQRVRRHQVLACGLILGALGIPLSILAVGMVAAVLSHL